MGVYFQGTVSRGKVGRTHYVENKTHTREQDNHIYYPKIGGSGTYAKHLSRFGKNAEKCAFFNKG